MKHIRQINSVGTNSYTIVKTDNYQGDLEDHPILTDSEIGVYFELVDCELPDYVQYVNYEKVF